MDNYRIIEKEYIEEIDSEAMRMVHEKSGAKLLVLKNDNPNKYFGISFMTPPYDSSGIPHILEHCVLAGSRKYPSGSFEKLNQSLSVGLMNAETGNDHTNYYCYTKEEHGFDDCTDLILDSVFYPLVLEEENIFLREGWRIDFSDDGNGDIDIDVSGIVLNEMRACDSDYKRRIRERICKRLMPNSVYHHRAGGKSYKIPRCSYEELITYHHKHYTASNAYVFIYGDVDLDSFLEKLDVYLKEKAGDEAVIIPKTDNVKELVRKKEKIHADQDEDHFYYYACLFDGKLKPNQALAFDLLKEEIEIIIESELSNIGIDGAAYSTFEQAGIQDRLEIKYVCDTEGAGKDIYKGIKRALTDRFDADNDFRAQLMGKINRYELHFWEEMHSKYSVGEYLYNMIQLYWFYSEDYVFDAFQVSDNIQYIKNRIWGNCFNTFITEELPKEGREILLECICDNRGEDYFSRRLYREIDNQVSGMEKEDILALRKKSGKFSLWNAENDSEEQNKQERIVRKKTDNCIPVQKPEYRKEEYNGVILYHMPVSQSKVVWLTLSFDADDFREHISEIQLLMLFINNRGFNDFYGLGAYEAKTMLTRSINASIAMDENYSETGEEKTAHIRIDISAVLLEENIPDVIRLIQHMLFDVFIAVPGFEEELQAEINRLRDNIYDNPDGKNTAVVGYNYEDISKYQDQIYGLSYYKFLCALRDGGQKALLSFYRNCYAMLNRIFCNDNLKVFCSSADRGFILVKKAITDKPFDSARKEMFSRLGKDYKNKIRNTKSYELRRENKELKKFVLDNYQVLSTDNWFTHKDPDNNRPNIGVIIPSNVNYISFYGKIDDYDYMSKDAAILRIAAKILEDSYMRVELREHGGAYGYSARAYRNGIIEFTTSRDPQIERTIKIIKGSADYLRNISLSNAELEVIKQSELGFLLDEEIKDPWDIESDVMDYELKGLDPAFNDTRIEAIRNCNIQDIKEAADRIQWVLDNGAFCVFGSKTDIEECSELFGYIERFDDSADIDNEEEEEENGKS